MLICLGAIAAASSIAVVCLVFKIVILKISLREIVTSAKQKFSEESNVPIAPQSRDKDILKLSDYLTEELDAVIAAHRKFAAGNSELKRAVTNVSHDLRTPLTSASGYLGLLKKSGLNEKQSEFVEIVEGRVTAMKKLTEELLAYSIIASDEGTLQVEEVCLNDCLEDSLTQFYVAFAERGIEPKIAICEKRIYRNAGKDALSRIFGNVINNAVRYSDGDFTVGMSEDGKIVFENGAEHLDEVSTAKLFDRFFTVENARGSTGLGLSIAKILTEKLGGTIGASWKNGRLRIVLAL